MTNLFQNMLFLFFLPITCSFKNRTRKYFQGKASKKLILEGRMIVNFKYSFNNPQDKVYLLFICYEYLDARCKDDETSGRSVPYIKKYVPLISLYLTKHLDEVFATYCNSAFFLESQSCHWGRKSTQNPRGHNPLAINIKSI